VTLPMTSRAVWRGDDAYEAARRALKWDAGVPDRYPEVIVRAAAADDVPAALGLARREGLQVTVRSGGHAWDGNSIRDGALVLDASALNATVIDRDALTASAQPGVQGAHLDEALRQQGLYFPVGHCTGACLGGYLLQGGIGWNGKQYGPACMHVTGLDVVTADGQARFVDDSHDPDLFWASKGSGPGFFAVVTRFHLRVYPRSSVTMTSSYLYPAESFDDVYGFVHEIGPKTPTEINMIYYRDAGIRADGPIIGLQATAFAVSEEEARDQLAIYESCPARDKVIATRPHELTDTTVLSRQGTDSHCFETSRYLADNMWTSAPFESLKPGIKDILSRLPAHPSHMVWISWGYENGPKRPSMPFIEDDFYYALYGACDDAAGDGAIREWVTEGMRSMEPFATGMALGDENTQNRPPGGRVRVTRDNDSFRRLGEVRSAYDPDRLFFAPW
jgi:FAD/FMN-containing dehydrogenase